MERDYSEIGKDFLARISEHKMTILQCEGLYRHLRFRKDDSIFYSFDIITWPGYLCICGDIGTFVFSRVPDMIGFFRKEKGDPDINPDYWAEKLQATDKTDGHLEFSSSAFQENVKAHFDGWAENEDIPKETKTRIWSKIEDEVLYYSDNEYSAVTAINDFYDKDFEFSDFWEYKNTAFTVRYIICCYAIVWAVEQYEDYMDGFK